MTRRPAVGDDVYLPSELYLWHGRDDFAGGLCRVVGVAEMRIGERIISFVEVAEQPGAMHNWEILAEQQDDLRARFGTRRGHPDPDWRPEFNDD